MNFLRFRLPSFWPVAADFRVTPVWRSLAAVLITTLPAVAAEPAAGALEWKDVPAIVARIRPPEFPAREFDIAAYGARGDGATDSLPAMLAAIEACVRAGGGHVIVPPGTYLLNGPIHLQSNVDLHVEEGATLRFSGQPEHFLPAVLTRWEGVILYNYSPMIYARGATNIAVTGRGVIDGNARREFRRWAMDVSHLQDRAQERSRQMGAKGTPIEERRFGEGDYLRPSLLETYECRNVLIEGVTLQDSPFWVVHPTFCTNVTVRDIAVESLLINNDGCDPDSCTDVLIEGCRFRTGDDGIAIKAGRDADGWRDGRRTENVVIRNCVFQSKINALCVGSEMSAGVRHVFMEDCRVEEGESCIYFKSNADRGGFIENVRVRRVQIDLSRASVVRFETNYHSYRGGHAPTAYRDFIIEDVRCTEATNYAVFAEGTRESPIDGVVLRNVEIARAREPLYLREVASFRFENVRVNGRALPVDPPETPEGTKKLEIRL